MSQPVFPVLEDRPALERAAAALTDAWNRDPGAVQALLCATAPANVSLADHPTIPVEPHLSHQELFWVRVLGLINGALGAACGGYVMTRWGEPIGPEGQREMLGFGVYEPPDDEPCGPECPGPELLDGSSQT